MPIKYIPPWSPDPYESSAVLTENLALHVVVVLLAFDFRLCQIPYQESTQSRHSAFSLGKSRTYHVNNSLKQNGVGVLKETIDKYISFTPW